MHIGLAVLGQFRAQLVAKFIAVGGIDNFDRVVGSVVAFAVVHSSDSVLRSSEDV